MSTIEEAREQARTVKASVDARLASRRLGKSTMREEDKDIHALRKARVALATLLDATEPPTQREHDPRQRAEHLAASKAEHALGEWRGNGTEPPAEDEREALVEVIRLFFQNWRSIDKVSAALEVSIDSLEGAVDDLIELGAPRPITDEMVEAARRAWHDADDSTGPGTRMRAALEAAEEARR